VRFRIGRDRGDDQNLARIEARLEQLEDRVGGLAGDSIDGSPQPELYQRVSGIEERLDRLIVQLTGSLGIALDDTVHSQS